MAKEKQSSIDWPRCKTCRWWQSDEDNACAPDQCRMCDCPKIGEDGWLRDHKTQDDLGVLAYPYDEGSGIMPGPEFGCVHHEEKA